MQKMSKLLTIILGQLLLISNYIYGQNAPSLEDAIKEGTVSLELRLSFEHSSVNQNTTAGVKNAHPGSGLNLRTRVGYRTGDYMDSNVFIQLQNVANIVEDFSFRKNGVRGLGDTGADGIGDPDGSRVHQVYFEFKGISDTKLRLGRQEIILDDARLIGNIGWRQNGQSFDGASIVNESIPGLKLYGAYITRVNSIFLGHIVSTPPALPVHKARRTELDHLALFNARLTLTENHHVALFTYLLDAEHDDVKAPGTTYTSRDSVTYGSRVNGAFADTFKYDLTYAQQGNYKDGQGHNGDMFNAFLGCIFEHINFGVGYSTISGSDGGNTPTDGGDRAFDTLFSTAHKFNGWADQFLNTNGGGRVQGLEDIYFQIGTMAFGTKFLLRYHIFDTTEDASANNLIYDDDYGDEIDLDITRKLTQNLTAQLRYAYYNQTNKAKIAPFNPTADEEVIWVRLTYKF